VNGLGNLLIMGYFTLMGATFVLWAYFWFRTLFKLNKIAKARRAEDRPGIVRSYGITFEIFGEFISKPEHRSARRVVLGMTVLLFAVIIFGRFALPLPAGQVAQ